MSGRRRERVGAPRLYRAALVMLPSSFRTRFGADMEAVFAERLREARTAGGRAQVWMRGMADLVRHGLAERRAAARAARQQSPGSRGPGPGGPRGRSALDSVAQDLGHAVRALRRSPGFSLVAVLTLALGIGANTAMFSVVNAVLLRPLPYYAPDRLVVVWPALNFNKTMVREVRDAVPALEAVSGISIWTLTVTGDGAEPIEIEGALVSANHFDVLGVQPMLGRGFAAEEQERGRGDVVILSYDFWQSRYGGDPAILGRSIRVSGADYDERTVIGVMGDGFRPIVADPQVWVVLEDPPAEEATLSADRSWFVNWRVGRLAQGATREQAEAQLRGSAERLRAEVPTIVDEEDVRSVSIEPLRTLTAGESGPMLWILFGAVALVLLIACANVANLLLARGEARARELAVRRALGARQGRILRLLVTESVVLGLIGGTAGLALAWSLVRAIVSRAPQGLPQPEAVTLDGAVLFFALFASVVAAALFGVVPALRVGRLATSDTLRQVGRGMIGGRAQSTVSRGLITAEVALAVLLVAGAGLMLRTLSRLNAVDPGFDATGVLSLRPNPPAWRYGEVEAQRDVYARMLERIRALPMVESAAGIQLLPVTGGNWSFPTYPEFVDVAEGTTPPSVNFRVITPDYLETMRIPVLQGRALNESDHENALRVAVVNRAFVERFWPDRDPIGRTVYTFSRTGTPYTVVGVVGDVHQMALDRAPRPELYVAHAQLPWEASLSFVVRMRDGRADEHAATVRDAIWSIDRDIPVSGLEPMQSVIGRSAATSRFIATLLGLFGALALTLGAVGVYGVTAYTVVRRMPEFGIRVALGATGGDVLRVAALRALAPVAAGVALGLLATLAATGLMRGLLFGVSPHDPVALGAGALLLALVGLSAALLPAFRATRIDPATVLRNE